MKRSRLKSELLATLNLCAGDRLAVVNIVAAIDALPGGAERRLAAGHPGDRLNDGGTGKG